MRTKVEYYCTKCKCTTRMSVLSRNEYLRVYWLRCSCCQNEWRVPREMFERQAHYVL